MPRRFRSGRAVASVTRNRPFPEPTSISTGFALPNTVGQSKGTGGTDADSAAPVGP